MLHTLALQFLSSRYVPSININNNNSSDDDSTTAMMMMEGAVLWITLSPVSERQVVMALRKGMQHNLAGSAGAGGGNSTTTGGGSSTMGNYSSLASNTTTGRIHVVSVPLEVADAALQDHDNNDDDNEEKQSDFSHEIYLKQLHQRIVHWLNHRELLSSSSSTQLGQQQNQQRQVEQSVSMGPNLVIIDNGTMISTIFGDTLSNAFLSSVCATLKHHSRKSSTSTATAAATTNVHTTIINTTNLLTIRTSSPDDGGLYQPSDEDNVMKGEKLRSEYSRLLRPWLGMGSGGPTISSSGVETTNYSSIVQMEEQSSFLSLASNSTVPCMVYRCGLYELADGIVDVSPLESGYARDVLGRLSFVTTWSGKGWWGSSSSSSGGGAAAASGGGSGIGSSSRGGGGNKDDFINGTYSSLCVNYRCDDSGVRVMRLRSR